MQKTLRGKRHLKARSSVLIGRDRKNTKKWNRYIFISRQVADSAAACASAMRKLEQTFIDARVAFSDLADKVAETVMQQRRRRPIARYAQSRWKYITTPELWHVNYTN